MDKEQKENYVAYDIFPLWKIAILSFFSNGIYFYVWFYKHWQTIENNKTTTNNVVKKPILQTILYPFSCFILFSKIKSFYSNLGKYTTNIQHFNYKFVIPTCFLLCFLLEKIFQRVDNLLQLRYGYTSYIGFTFFLLQLIILLCVQHTINSSNKKMTLTAACNKWTWKSTIFLIVCIVYSITYVYIFSFISNYYAFLHGHSY